MDHIAITYHLPKGALLVSGLFFTGYGMTETSPGVLHPPLGHVKLGSVGIPLPNTEVKVSSGSAVNYGES